ncbi:Cache sensor protein [Belliella sp. DSM 111904]|uniref:Cache sensor protein n=2 Tax=Belliella filtrata TaxID=2923435 RepID=A0ABS9UZX5_9BACT|nr:Cache sensor protein [Belliella filtrata]
MIDFDFQALEEELLSLSEKVQALYEDKDNVLKRAELENKYIKVGHYANSAPNHDPELCTLYFPQLPNVSEKAVREMMLLTNDMDEEFRKVVEESNVISQVYFNSKVQFNRLYPPYDVATMIEPNLDVTSYNFYYEADELNNPEKGLVWVKDIYIDPVGQGWVISLLNPVYVEDDLKMVMAFDISVNVILENYLSKTEKKLVVIDEKGTVIAGKSKAIEALDLPPLRNHTYIQTITSNNFRLEEYNLFKSKDKDVRRMISHFMLSGGDQYSLQKSTEKILVTAYPLDRTGWLILDVTI